MIYFYYLIKPLTMKNLRENIDIFIRQSRLNTQYIVIQIKLSYNNGKNKKTLCNKIAIDLNSKIQIKTLRNLIIKKFDKLSNKHPHPAGGWVYLM